MDSSTTDSDEGRDSEGVVRAVRRGTWWVPAPLEVQEASRVRSAARRTPALPEATGASADVQLCEAKDSCFSGTVPLRGLRQKSQLVAWGVLPMVAGLFVLVEGLALSGAIDALARALVQLASQSAGQSLWGAGIVSALASNLINNLFTAMVKYS